MAVCNEAELLADGACLNCLLPHQRELARTALLCQWWQSLDAGADCSPNALLAQAAAGGATTLLPGQLGPLVSQLLCNMGGGVGSTSFNCVNETCVDPGDGSGTYATLAECQAACTPPPSPGLFGLCFADSSWFAPAYSTANNRVAAANASLGGLPDSRIKLYDVEEIGLVNIGNTRVQSGGLWVSSVNKFYFGVSSGGTVPGSPSSTEAIVIVDPVTFAAAYVGGFTDPSAASSPAWVSSTSRVWFRLSGATPGFTILDPSDNSHVEISDPLFTSISAFVYVPSADAIYASAFDEIIKIDVHAPYAASVVYTALDTTFGGIEYVSTTDRIWIGFVNSTIGSPFTGVFFIDPSTDLSTGSITLLSGFIIPAPSFIYHSAAFGQVLIQEALFLFPQSRLFSTNESGSGPLVAMDASLGRITGKGVYIPTINKELLPFSSATGICLTYLTEEEFAGSVLPTWNCTGSVCVDPGDGTGIYALGVCETACLPAPPLTYDCVTGSCVARTNGTGQYNTLAECEANCACEFVLNPASASIPAAGASETFDVTAGPSCDWTAVSNDAWITVDSGSPGTGNGTVGYTVAENVGAERVGTITVSGETFTITQAAPGGGGITSPEHFWPLEEAGDFDVRVDEIGGATMSPNNTLNGQAALIGNGVHWTQDATTNLSTSGTVSGISYTAGNDFSINFWLRKVQTGAFRVIPNFRFQSGTQILLFNQTDVSELTVTFSTASLIINPITFDTSWHMYTAVYTAATGLVEIFRDAVSQGVTDAPIVFATDANLFIQFDGQVSNEEVLLDLFGVWTDYALTGAEITSLFNGGAGLTWPF